MSDIDDENLARQEALEVLRRGAGIGLNDDGEFTYQGNKVAHPRVQALFHRGIAVRDDGEVTLTVGPWWCYVKAGAVVRFASRVGRGEPLDRASLLLLDGSALPLSELTLGYGPDDRLYAWHPRVSGPIRLLRDAHQWVMARIEGAEQPVVVWDEGAIGLTLLEQAPGSPLAEAPAG